MKKKAIKIDKFKGKLITKRKPEDGRPKIVFDLKAVQALGAIQCTYEEMAAVLNCSPDTITNRMKEDLAFSDAYKKGVESGKMSIKKKQYNMSEGGNVTMLIWWGKQHLGQTDKVVQKNINAGSLALLTHLSPKERLEALKRGLMDNPGAGGCNGNNNAADTNK
jgi:hypothetical protein